MKNGSERIESEPKTTKVEAEEIEQEIVELESDELVGLAALAQCSSGNVRVK